MRDLVKEMQRALCDHEFANYHYEKGKGYLATTECKKCGVIESSIFYERNPAFDNPPKLILNGS